MKKILARINLCKEENESTASFARRIGVSQQTTHNYLSGGRKISLEFINSICCNCQVSADWLLGFTDERTGTAAPIADAALQKKVEDLKLKLALAEERIKGLEFAFNALKR
jgi:transcriptional regulator with XRE-family HTH domain